jgi:protein disulfide-isomerase A1
LNDKECAASYGANTLPAIVLFRKFDESPLVFSGNFDTTPIVDWLVGSSVPTLIEFSEDYIEPIFGQRKSALFLFRNEEDASSDYSKLFEQAAKELKGDVLFVVSGVKEGIQQRLAEFVGVEESQVPTVTLLNPGENMKKYKFPGTVKDLSLDSIKSFLADFTSGKLQPFLKSQDPPAEQNEAVITLVGKTFNDIVLDDSKDVLVEFYAPWCGHCKKLAPIWEEVAKDLKDAKDLVIAKIDSTANEVEDIEIRGYPTLKFFPKGNKKNPVDYDGGREAEDIKNWLKENSSVLKKHLDSKSEL